MIDINEINEEIKKLENSETCYKVCEKLAMLYTVRDHYKNDTVTNASNMAKNMTMEMNMPSMKA